MRGSSTGIRRIATATLAMAALGWTAALAEERVALLIGNERYASAQLSNLSNPANDARALEPVLARLGFATDVLVDADRAAAEAALHEFSADAAGAEVALFFFSGHAVQIEGTNRLLTAGFSQRIEPESGTERFLAEVERETLDLDAVREALAAAAPDLGLIVLDSCRDNPFIDSGLAVRGLARAPGRSRLLIAFATDPGNVAYDGGGANSPFTAALLDHIATPGLEVRLMFGRVRQDVVLATGGR